MIKRTVRLSDLVSTGDFLEGSSIYHNRSILLVSKLKMGEDIVVKGHLKGFPSKTVSFSLNKNGGIVDQKCFDLCHGLCRHVVALALLYNEMEIDNADPSEQLSGLKTKNVSKLTEFPVRITIKNGSVYPDIEPDDMQFCEFTDALKGNRFAIPVALFPEKFILDGRILTSAKGPLPLFYKVSYGEMKIYLPERMVFFKEEGVAIDCEESRVFRLSSSVSETVTALLNISISYSNKDEAAKALADLSDNLHPHVVLNGDINLEKIELGPETETVFKTTIENGKIFVTVVFLYKGEEIEFKPKRNNSEQNYVHDGRIYYLAPILIKNVKNALTRAGLRFVKGRYYAPVSRLHMIIGSGSELAYDGRVVSENIIKKLTIEKEAADNTEIILDIDVPGEWFSFKIKLPETDGFISSSELIEAIKQFEKGVVEPVVTDIEGNPVIIEKSGPFLQKISELIYSGLLNNREKIPMPHILKLLKLKNKKTISGFSGDESSLNRFRSIIDSMSRGEMPVVEQKVESAIPLRKYQQEGYKWLMLLRELGLGGILADEMGLGKTLQALAMLKSEAEDEPSLVICPKTLIWSWDREIEKFFPEMKRVVIDALKPEERAAKWKNSRRELIITSYALVINDFAHLLDKRFKTVVIDEAQHIKNNNTKRFKILSSIKTKHRFALTGTPLENHLSDLWSIFQFIMPGYLGKKKDVQYIEKNEDVEKYKDLRSMASPFILRRTKLETLEELPELIIKEYPVDMTPKQKEIYISTLLRGRAEFIEKGDDINKVEILSILTRLRQAANHPSLVSETDSDPFLSSKIHAVKELTDEIISGGGRVLIFSQFVTMLGIVAKAINDAGRDFFYMDGKTENRMDLVKRFNEGEKEIFLLSLKVGGVGLNLTGADNVIIIDPWWNPAVEEQAWSRAHRLGQKRKVVVNKLYSKGTIEEKILDMHIKKRGLTGFFMSGTLKDPDRDFVKRIADMELALKGEN